MGKRGNVATVLKIDGDASGAIKSIKLLTDNVAKLRSKLARNLGVFKDQLNAFRINDKPIASYKRALTRIQNDQLVAFQRSARYLEAQKQALQQQLVLQRAIAKSSSNTVNERRRASSEAERLRQHLGVINESQKTWHKEFRGYLGSILQNRAYAGRVSEPSELPVRHRTRREILSERFSNYYRNLQGAWTEGGRRISSGGLMTASAIGAFYSANYAARSFMDFVKPGGEVAQLVKNIYAVTGQDLPELSQEIKKLGKSTPYTTKQVAAAAYSMSKAGFSAKDIKTALSGSIYMGLATDSDPTAAADVTAQTLSHFNLNSKYASRIGNLYSKAMVTSPASLSELAYTMQYAGPAAVLSNTDFSTTLSMAGILAKNGIRGSKAGTGLRSVFTRLSAPGKAAQESLLALGVRVKDLKGNLRGIPDIFEDLNKSMKKLSTTQKTAHLKNIFGQVAMGSASILMEKSGELKKYITELRNADKENSAAVIAKMKQDSYEGDIQKFSSAFEGLQIAVFDAVEGKLRLCVQHMTDLVSKTTDWINNNHDAISFYWDIGQKVAEIAGGLAVAWGIFGAINTSMGALSIAMAGVSGLATAFAEAGLIASGAFGLVLGSVILIYYYWDDIMQKTNEWTDKLSKFGFFNDLEPTMKTLRNKFSYQNATAAERQKANSEAAISYWLTSKYGQEFDNSKNRKILKILSDEQITSGTKYRTIENDVKDSNLRAELLSKVQNNSLNKELDQIASTQMNQISKQGGGWKNASQFVASEDINYRRKKFYQNLSEQAKQENYQSVGAMWLRENITQARAQRANSGDLSILQQNNASLQQLSNNLAPLAQAAQLSAVNSNVSEVAPNGPAAGVVGSPVGTSSSTKGAATSLSPELLQALSNSQKPTNNTVNVAGTSVSVSVHCDASSIQTFVNEVVRAAKPQIDAMVSAQIEKVKGALTATSQKKTAAASML